MENSDVKYSNAIEEALRLLAEIDGNYTRQLKQILDAEVVALLEALKMFHENNSKKLKSRVREATS